MYQHILAHKKYVADKLSENPTDKQRKQLFRYHVRRVRDFQHERLVHLLVTFFFGFLLLVSVAVLLFTPVVETKWPLGALALLLFVLELAYIRHYYQLENGVQSLYEYTEKLGKS